MIPLRHRLAAGLLIGSLLAVAPSLWSRRGDPVPPPGGEAVADSVAALLRGRLAASEAAVLLSPELVTRFYADRAYAPAWSGPGAIAPEAAALASAVRAAGTEGLDPRHYRLAELEEAFRRLRVQPRRGGGLDPGERTTLDILLTDAFLTYGTHLVRGRVDPRAIHSGWSLEPRSIDVPGLLERALQTGQIETTLTGLTPTDPGYVALREALRRYRTIAASGGWAPLPPDPTLRPGDRSEAVARLRTRLASEVRLGRAGSPDIYDPALEAAVREFQRDHGLRDDAAVGPGTRAALNVGADERAEQIELSMERLRWLPANLGRRHVRVSIPAFELAVVQEGRTALSMRVVGGRPDWRTPIFSARMTSVVLSPYWNIPASIAEAEVLPRERREPGYMARNGIRWVGDGAGGTRLRQDPGPLNPLGGVKFLFPNPYNTYLHDTPSRHLFAEPMRAFSHGCMRVEKPLEMAEYLLGPLGWDREEIRAGMARGVERSLMLEEPIPVHVLYQTAWVDADGHVQFRDDLYGHDRRLATALEGSVSLASERASGECLPAIG